MAFALGVTATDLLPRLAAKGAGVSPFETAHDWFTPASSDRLLAIGSTLHPIKPPAR